MEFKSMAKIFGSKILRTNVKSRPYPSLFYFPGLSSQPFHDPPSFASDFQENIEMIQTEYKSLRKAFKDRDDYEKIEGESLLNDGSWHWMNYIQKGERTLDGLFKEHCPITTHLLEQSIGRDNLMTGTPFSYTFFSTMSPGT